MDRARDALRRAKESAGGGAALTRLICARPDGARRLTPQALSQWDRVPVDRVIAVEAVTGIPREDLRPDIYPPSPSRSTGGAE